MTPVEFCYFAALIDGLRLINEKEREKGVNVQAVDPGALYQYSRRVGDQLVGYLSEKELLDMTDSEGLRPDKPEYRCLVCYSRCSSLGWCRSCYELYRQDGQYASTSKSSS